jgi:hypothetical protein
MSIIGLQERAPSKPTGVQTRGALVKAPGPQGAKSEYRPWTIYSHRHLALGLFLQTSVKLNSTEVKELQQSLADLGFYDGDIDGIFGRKTKAAHEDYRESLLQHVSFGPTPEFVEHVVKAAEAEADAKVVEVGNNRGARVEEYQRAAANCGAGSAWCAAFLCWCFQQAASKAKAHFDLPREPGAFRFEDWALGQRSKGIYLLDPENLEVLRGDIVIFNFSHIGICSESEDAKGKFGTIEGNTVPVRGASAKQAREGYGVFRKSAGHDKLRTVVRVGYPTVDWLPFHFA